MKPNSMPLLITDSSAPCDQDVIRALLPQDSRKAPSERKAPLSRWYVAEGEGFEPSRPVKAYPLSRQADGVSGVHASTPTCR